MLGLALLMISTVLFAVATTFTTLVIARVLQGISAALVNTVGMAMVIDTVGSNNLGGSLGTV
jgi:predicted MFS family arabinose efflux permease